MRKKRITKQASYRAGVQWIALNDNAGADQVPADCRDGQLQAEVRGRIAEYLTTLLLADLFGADPELVAADIFRERQMWLHAAAKVGADIERQTLEAKGEGPSWGSSPIEY